MNPEISAAGPPPPFPRDLLLKAILWIALLLVLFPAAFIPLSTGLDASYLYAINALPGTDLLFGRDVAFTYGPLGYLLLPSSFGNNLAWAMAFRVAMHALFAFILASLFLRGVSAARVASFSVLYLLAVVLGLPYDYQLLLLLALWLGSAQEIDLLLPVAAPLCAALAVFFSLIKVNLGIASCALVASYLATIFLRRKPGRWVEAGLAAAAFVIAAVACVVIYFETPGNFLRWIHAQSELARGFGSAMSYRGEPAVLVLGLAALAVFLVLLARFRLRERSGSFWWMTLLPVLLAFKHGFTRQDAHVVLFFSFLLGVLAVGLLVGRGEAEARASLGSCLAVLLLAVPVALAMDAPRTQEQVALVTGQRGAGNLRSVFRLPAMRRDVERRGRRQLEPALLPAAFVDPARARNLGVDVVPAELSYLPANGLRWVPSPVLQLYSAYTRDLDAWTARHYEGPRAPDLVLAEFRGVSSRNMVWDSPETWRAIVRRYEPMGVRPRPGLLALRKRTSAPDWSWRKLGEERLRSRGWTRVPRTDDWLFAELQMPLDLSGRLAETVFRLPPVFAEVVYDDGRKVRWRLLPETAGSGILMNHAPRNLRGLAALWRGGPKSHVVRFRLRGPGLRFYPDSIRVVWRAARLGPAPAGAVTQ